MANTITWNCLGFLQDGKPTHLISGEFPYFRVPRKDWVTRMRLFKAAGGNVLSTYVPWLIHEPEEGHIIFGDCDARDLAGFLKTAKEEGLMVTLRPGPYQYSELINDGLPTWLLENYPQVMARDIDGKVFRTWSISYQHPVLLEKVRNYFREYANVVRPYMAANGGPVVMTQLDNELTGIHLWWDTLDYNRETMGFGKPEGKWPLWLKNKYKTVSAMNAAYGTEYDDFAAVYPVKTAKTDGEQVLVQDYDKFYVTCIADFMELLASWLKEDGIPGPFTHNSGNPNMNALFLESVDRLGDELLLGSDQYYQLNARWTQNNPTPQYALKCLYSMDLLRGMGLPPTVFELPGGNVASCPPILPNDLLACYLTNDALGMKGFNYYIFTGGPNYPETGASCAVYDFNASIAADGEIRDTYEAQVAHGKFLKDHAWLSQTERTTAVQLGFAWDNTRFTEHAAADAFNGAMAWEFSWFDLGYSFLASKFPAEHRPITGALELTKPLVLSCPERMSHREQEAVVNFVKNGGKLLILPRLPDKDETGKPDTFMAETFGISGFAAIDPPAPYIRVAGMEDAYMFSRMYTAKLPESAEPVAYMGKTEQIVGASWRVGEGTVLWLGVTYDFCMDTHAKLMEHLVSLLGAKPVAESSNRNVFTSYWADEDHALLYVMNLHSSPQSAKIVLHADGTARDLGTVNLQAMQVLTLDL